MIVNYDFDFEYIYLLILTNTGELINSMSFFCDFSNGKFNSDFNYDGNHLLIN